MIPGKLYLLYRPVFQNVEQLANKASRLANANTLVVTAIVLLTTCSNVAAQDAPANNETIPIYDTEPHDAITVVASQGGGVFDVFPIDFPGGKKPTSPKPGSKLTVRLLSEPEREYTIAWQHIEKVEVFNELVLNEARELVNSGKYDEAFRYLAYLNEEAPNIENTDRVMMLLLQSEAKAAMSGGDMHEALSLLDELYRVNPRVKGLQNTIIGVTNRLFDDYVKKRNYLAAKKMLTWAVERFGQRQMATTVRAWQKKLDSRAALRLKQANQFLADGELRKAYDASREIQQLAPNLPGADRLFKAVGERYVAITVGVSRMGDPTNLSGNDWASRRVRRLLNRSISELSGIGPDGGEYASPMATLQIGDDGRSLVVKVRRNLGATSASGFKLAERMLENSNASATDAPLWSELINGATVRNVFDVRVDLRRSFLRPEGLLQFPWGGTNDLFAKPYVVTDRNEKQLFLRQNNEYLLRAEDQPQDITEQFYQSTTSAIQAISEGAIDIIERIYPADLDIIRSVEGITVEKYAIPSVHMLIPNFNRPHTGNRRFRRALAYGISRETLLGQDLLGGTQVAGCRLISGPFPADRFDDDSLGYAYDRNVSPRPYEPRLAVTFSEIAHQELVAAATKSGEPIPDRPKLRLLHPDGEIPRIASAGISQYLTAVGIECEAIPMPPGESWPTNNNWDLLYYDNVLADPILDAHRLLGSQGLCGGGSSHLELALRQLATADNWQDASTRLHQIHALSRQEGAIIPLWQLTDHFAYSKRVSGIEPEPVSLYDGIESWRLQTGN